MTPDKQQKLIGGVIGLLVGDALGVPYEFHDASEIPAFGDIEFECPVDFRRAHAGIPPGTYSDDGAQALILLNSLLECGRFDADHFACGLVDWYDAGFMAVGGKVFDVGIQTSESIRAIKRGVAPLLAGGTAETSNGNGSLMRVLPLALWHQGSDLELIADAFDQSSVTHAHPRSRVCCAIYCLWGRNVLHGFETPFTTAIETFKNYFRKGTSERDELDSNILPDDREYEIRGSGYVVDSFRAAIHLCSTRDDYESVVKHAVALGRDTDTTACIAGGIAGLMHGADSIPERWQRALLGDRIYRPLIEKLISSVV